MRITPSKVYADCELVFWLMHCNAQPEYLPAVLVKVQPDDAVVPVLLKPGSELQFVPVCTLPSIWTPMDNMIAIAMNAPTSPMIVEDSAKLIVNLCFLDLRYCRLVGQMFIY